jgi:hypothetical protein
VEGFVAAKTLQEPGGHSPRSRDMMDMKECVTKHYTLRMALATIRATPAVVLGMRQRLSSLRLWMKKRLEKSHPTGYMKK